MGLASCRVTGGVALERNPCHSPTAIGRFGSCLGCIRRRSRCRGPRGPMLSGVRAPRELRTASGWGGECPQGLGVAFVEIAEEMWTEMGSQRRRPDVKGNKCWLTTEQGEGGRSVKLSVEKRGDKRKIMGVLESLSRWRVMSQSGLGLLFIPANLRALLAHSEPQHRLFVRGQ